MALKFMMGVDVNIKLMYSENQSRLAPQSGSCVVTLNQAILNYMAP